MRKGTHPRTALGQTAAQMIRRYYLHDVARDSAALTYYLLFAIFPLLIFVSTLLGILELDVDSIVTGLRQIVPGDVAEVVRQLRQTLLVCVILPQHRGAQPHQHRIVPLVFPVFFQSSAFHVHPRFRFSPNNIVYPAAKVKNPQPKSCGSCKKCLYLSRPKRLLNFATRPPVSTSFCLPVKKG